MENYFIVYQVDFDKWSIEITYHTKYFLALTLDEIDLNALMCMLDELGFQDITPGDDE